MSTQEANFGIQAALRRHFERDRDSQMNLTLRALLASDVSRLEFFDASRAIAHFDVQRRYVAGDVERVVIEAAESDPELIACVGYESTAGSRPVESSWLLDSEHNLIDPQQGHRQVDAFLGVALRASEVSNWTPSQPGAVAERLIDRVAV